MIQCTLLFVTTWWDKWGRIYCNLVTLPRIASSTALFQPLKYLLQRIQEKPLPDLSGQEDK